MERYFFHIRLANGKVVEDHKGLELPTLETAVDAATLLTWRAAKSLAKQPSVEPKAIEIADLEYHLLATVPAQ